MKKWRTGIFLAVLLLAFLASTVGAMGSTNYDLDWFAPLDVGGGGAMSSTNYDMNLSIGTMDVSQLSSTNYTTRLGYWPGVYFNFWTFLPMTLRQ